MFLVIFFSIFFQIVARPSKESGFLTFNDAPGQKFTSEEVETIMEFAQRRIAEQLALAATGQNDPSLMESLVRLKEEIVMDKQVPKSIPPVRHLDAVIAKPQNPQFSPDHIHLRRPNYGASQENSRQNGNSRPSHGAYDSGKIPSKPQRQSLSKANSNDPVVSYVRIEPTANRNVQKPPSLSGPIPPMTEAATDLWKGTNLDAKHDFQPKISVQNEGAEQERIPTIYAHKINYSKPQQPNSDNSYLDIQWKPTTRPAKNPTFVNVPYEINYCDTNEFSEDVLATYGLERIDGFVYNATCNQRFFACAIGKTFSRKCQSDELIFDPKAVSCNYKNLVTSCHLDLTTTTMNSEFEDIPESDFRPLPLAHEKLNVAPIV